MNQVFEWSRFCKVVKKDFCNIRPAMGSTLLFLMLIPAALWLMRLVFSISSESYYDMDPLIREQWIGAMCIFAGILAPSRLYGKCNLVKEGIYYAMLPASKLEKYLSMLLQCLLVCPLIVLIGNYLIDIVLTILPMGSYHEWLWNDMPSDYHSVTYYGSLDLTLDSDNFFNNTSLKVAGWFFSVFYLLFVKMIFVFTNTIFKKHKVSKTILCLIGIGFVLILTIIPLLAHFGDDMTGTFVEWINDIDNLASIVWGINVILLILSAALIWWTGRRLKKMPY